MEETNNDTISFSVDAGLIDRLGRELVGKAETAVSELVKNAYDADAREVEVNFVQTQELEGTLIVSDNGLGMELKQLRDGFMTISSSDKIHNPISERYKRSRAGRKGIGRFATQRLGKKLTIVTQTLASTQALKLTINWEEYKIDTSITSIANKIEYVEKTKEEGTDLIIEGLRESWSYAAISRVYRYVSDLLQPDYISDRSRELGLAKQKDESFKVRFVQTIDGQELVVADPDKMLFSKALATIEGYVDSAHDGYCSVSSPSFEIPSEIIEVPHNKIYKEGEDETKKYKLLNEVHFKAYYFIYNREKYYTNISKSELKSIQNLANEQGGIRLYRNGFRVLPYGEPNDDWLNIDRRYYNDSGTNAPFGNRNLFGFVEIIDPGGKLFEETASREGLIENEAYLELVDFLHKALEAGRDRLRYGVEKIKKQVYGDKPPVADGLNKDIEKSTIEKLDDLAKNVDDLIKSSSADLSNQDLRDSTQRIVEQLRSEFQRLLDELGMLRVLAALGLTIGEFTHEVVQFSPSIMGDLSVLSNQQLDSTGINSLENLKRTIQIFTSYTSYFNATVSANVSRELKPQQLDVVVAHFVSVIEADAKKLGISFENELFGYDLVTIPMHSSEWSSILFNLYTNSKKAIKREGVAGRIRIVIGKEEKKVYLEFSDNGDGIPDVNRERIFEAFFTTSTPVGFDPTEDEKTSGTGLGLKIVRDIVQTYGGEIKLISPEAGFSTCFRIEFPLATEKQKEEHAV
jgi:signal transduction histidine kinase